MPGTSLRQEVPGTTPGGWKPLQPLQVGRRRLDLARRLTALVAASR